MRLVPLFIFANCLVYLHPIFAIDYRGFPEWSHQVQGETEYMLYTPEDLSPDKKVPIVLFMHGCCGEDDRASLRNAVDAPIRMWHQFAKNKQVEPTYLIAPATSRGWERHFENLITVIDDLVEKRNGDPQRIYVCGFSMGGRGTWQIINQYPDYFAAAIAMGMDFHGDYEAVAHVPTWTIRGETDWWARNLVEDVAALRGLNGDDRGAVEYSTGVNPRFTDFKGKGHVIMWEAASQLELVEWAYSKVNDGNRYPNVFFRTPENSLSTFYKNELTFEVEANDPDGSIEKVELWRDDVKIATRTEAPYRFDFEVEPRAQTIRAKAFDDRGKSSVAEIVIHGTSTPIISRASRPIEFATVEQGEKLYTDSHDEINISNAASYNGLTLLRLENASRNDNGSAYLTFRCDTDVNLYVAYENFGAGANSTFPAWLQDFERQPDEIVAQFRYFTVFKKRFQSGDISLPGANAEANGVESNYFLMIEPAYE